MSELTMNDFVVSSYDCDRTPEFRRFVHMNLPLQISFRNINHDDGIEDAIKEKVAKLDRRFRNIVGCRVVVEVPHRHHKHGNYYNVRIDISVPGEEIVVNRDPGDRSEDYKDYHVALRDAFDAAERQLADYANR